MSDKTREQQHFEAIHRGNEARQLLENTMLIAAFKSVKDTLHEQWAKSPARDAEGREKLFQMLGLLKMVENHIRSHIETGEQADIVFKDEQARRKIFGII